MLATTYVIVSADGKVITDSESNQIEQYDSLEEISVTLAALKTSLPFLTFEPVKVTRVDYCGECHTDFEKQSIVHYALIENNCFCFHCKDKLNIKVWELRYFIGKD